MSHKHHCYICKKDLYAFKPYKKGSRSLSPLQKGLQMVGSDVDNFRCPHCGCNDRERHLFMYIDALNLWDIFKGNTLHFAPEANLQKAIESQAGGEYIKADLFPASETVERIDATDIHYPDHFFDCIICNHVLEHIPDLTKALSEFLRVLKKGGHAILQTPYSRLLHHSFEDCGIQSETLRKLFYGQDDHVRIFGRDFFNLLEQNGFSLDIRTHREVLPAFDSRQYGINPDEPFILTSKA